MNFACSESIAEMCEELQNGSLPLLILTPNGREEAGTNRDCFILNPSANSTQNLKMFQFLGVLMGIAIRTGSPLSLNLAEPAWKALVISDSLIFKKNSYFVNLNIPTFSRLRWVYH